MADLAKIQGQELLHKMVELGNDWQLVNDHHIEKTLKFKDFKEALAFTNRVGELAEKESHHPDILLGYGKVKLTLWTHSIDGLSEKDFILAAKANSLLSSVK